MSAVIEVKSLDVAYGEVPIVRNAAFTIASGEVVALLGRNGMGKTTLMRGLMGLASVRKGHLHLIGRDAIAATPEMISRFGIGYVPAGRGIFGSLTVRENLVMCERPGPDGSSDWTIDRVLELFPRLAERIGHGGQRLSGGEQQMLAVGRALMTNPKVLLIDEATEGLAPMVARDIWSTLTKICASGVAAIIVDRDVKQLANIAGRALVMFKGDIVFDGDPDVLLADEELVRKYLGL
jgi:branched-chain amino acid transport system ATP-binding protein